MAYQRIPHQTFVVPVTFLIGKPLITLIRKPLKMRQCRPVRGLKLDRQQKYLTQQFVFRITVRACRFKNFIANHEGRWKVVVQNATIKNAWRKSHLSNAQNYQGLVSNNCEVQHYNQVAYRFSCINCVSVGTKQTCALTLHTIHNMFYPGATQSHPIKTSMHSYHFYQPQS